MEFEGTNDKNEVTPLFDDGGYEELNGDEDQKRYAILSNLMDDHRKSMSEHSAEYTQLLRDYISNSRYNSHKKNAFKNVFFLVSMFTLVFSFVLFALVTTSFLFKDWRNMDISAVGGLVTSLVGMLSLYIIIPKIIAKYLFNIKEDENMAKVVKSVQKYDAKVFLGMSKNNSIAEDKKEENIKKYVKEIKGSIEQKEKSKELDDILDDAEKSKRTQLIIHIEKVLPGGTLQPPVLFQNF